MVRLFFVYPGMIAINRVTSLRKARRARHTEKYT